MVYIGIFIYSIIIFKQTVQRENYTVTSSISKKDLFFDNKTLTLTKDNFDAAFMLSGINNQTVAENIQEYFSIYFQTSLY